MSSAPPPSFQSLPNEVALNILSFLSPDELKTVGCVSRAFNKLSSDPQIWEQKTEQQFSRILAQGAKQPDESWKQTYEALEDSRKVRAENVNRVLQTHITKVKRDDLLRRTQNAAATIFGFTAPTSNTHYIPSQTGAYGGHKITVFKSTS